MRDLAYQARFTDELLRAIMDASIVDQPGQARAAIVRSYEVVDSMLSMIAILSATSTETETPAKTRALCDQIARKLQKRINAAKQQPSPFETYSPEGVN